MNRLRLLVVSLLVSACGGDVDDELAAALPSASLPGTYSGTFPCDNCPGIRTRLWLRSDGRFFISQRYADSDSAQPDAYNLGIWRWKSFERVLVLTGAGPERIFARSGRDELLLRTASDLEHRLKRDRSAPEFSARIRMEGMVSVQGREVSFLECLTGLETVFQEGGDFGSFMRQYRSVGVRGQPVFVDLEGRFSWSSDGAVESLAVERFYTIKPGATC